MHTESPEYLRHREEAAQQLSSEGRRYFNLIEFDPNERLVGEIRKHPFGLFLILLTGGFVMLAMAVAAMIATGFDAEGFFGTESLGSLRPVLVITAFLMILATAVATFIAAFLYRSNVIYITSEKLAQVLYISLFNRKISQLSIGDVQDVTVTQKGILAHLFNYGTLVIETAGEQQNYTFTFVPDPYQVSKSIVGAHEHNLQEFGN